MRRRGLYSYYTGRFCTRGQCRLQRFVAGGFFIWEEEKAWKK
jgi:hypothetical protein